MLQKSGTTQLFTSNYSNARDARSHLKHIIIRAALATPFQSRDDVYALFFFFVVAESGCYSGGYGEPYDSYGDVSLADDVC